MLILYLINSDYAFTWNYKNCEMQKNDCYSYPNIYSKHLQLFKINFRKLYVVFPKSGHIVECNVWSHPDDNFVDCYQICFQSNHVVPITESHLITLSLLALDRCNHINEIVSRCFKIRRYFNWILDLPQGIAKTEHQVWLINIFFKLLCKTNTLWLCSL